MPKNPSTAEKNWGVEVNALDENGQQIFTSDSLRVKTKVRMRNGCLPNGEPQFLYFEPSHKKEGLFKGMAQILKERDITVNGIWAACMDFAAGCAEANRPDCCCRRILYNQENFMSA